MKTAVDVLPQRDFPEISFPRSQFLSPLTSLALSSVQNFYGLQYRKVERGIFLKRTYIVYRLNRWREPELETSYLQSSITIRKEIVRRMRMSEPSYTSPFARTVCTQGGCRAAELHVVQHRLLMSLHPKWPTF